MKRNERSESRKVIMTILYQIDLLDISPEQAISDNVEIANEFVNSTVYGVTNNREELDQIIDSKLRNWKLNRLGRTDKAILRIGAYELLKTDTPDIVAINEAVELAKQFSDDEVVGIINGVLDNIYKSK